MDEMSAMEHPYVMVGDLHRLGTGELGVLYGFYEGDAGDETDIERKRLDEAAYLMANGL